MKTKEELETVLKKGVDIQFLVPVYTERKKLETTDEMICEQGVSIHEGPGVNTPELSKKFIRVKVTT